MGNINLSDAIVILSVVGPLVASLGAALYQWLLQSMPASKRAALQQTVDTVVRAVDQQYAALPGPAKKATAVAMIEAVLKSRHIAASPEEVSALIEAAVGTLHAGLSAAAGLSTPDSPAAVPASEPAVVVSKV